MNPMNPMNPLSQKICTILASTWLGVGALVASPLSPASAITLSQESEPVGATLLQSSSVPFIMSNCSCREE